MTKLLQTIFIKILNPISALPCSLSENVRKIIIQVLCFCFPVFFILLHAGILKQDLSLNETGFHIVGTAILLLLIYFSIDRPLQYVVWRKALIYPMIIIGIGIILISFFHTIGSGYRAFGLMLIIIYPCLFFVWNNRRDYEKLFVPLSIASCVIGLLLFIYCFYQATGGEFDINPGGRCFGPLRNPNAFSMIGMVTFCAALYLFINNGNKKRWFLFDSFSLGIGFTITVLGQSRVSTAVCIVSLFATIFFYLRYCGKTTKTMMLLKTIIIFNVVLLSLFAGQCMVAIQQANVASIPEAPPSSSAIDRFDTDEAADANAFSSGRIEIWESYSDHLNMVGNDFNSVDWDSIAHDPSYHAHNNFFEMAFRFGIPVGVLFILLELIAGLVALQYLFLNRKKNKNLLFPILIMIMFAFESMLEIATLSFERITPCYFYLALIPLVDASINKKEQKMEEDDVRAR